MAKTKRLTKEELLKLAKTMTIQEIADTFNASYTTIWKRLKEAGYKSKVGRPKLLDIGGGQ